MIVRHRQQAGFTLVELLVSLAIMGMMAAMLLSGLVTGRRVWERVEDRTRAGEDVASSQALLRSLVRRLYPQGSFQGSQPYILFTGSDHAMLFQSAAPDTQAPAPPLSYRLSLSAGGGLVLDSGSTLAPDPSRLADRTIITTGVRALDLAYYGAAAPDNRPRWRNQWVRQARLPQMIRIRAMFAPGDRRRWPELLVQPAATVDTLCVYVPATGRCRGRT